MEEAKGLIPGFSNGWDIFGVFVRSADGCARKSTAERFFVEIWGQLLIFLRGRHTCRREDLGSFLVQRCPGTKKNELGKHIGCKSGKKREIRRLQKAHGAMHYRGKE